MATLKILRPISQQKGLTGRSYRSPLYKKYADRPLMNIASFKREEEKQPVKALSVSPDLGFTDPEGEGGDTSVIGGEPNPSALSTAIGDNIAASLAGIGSRGTAKTAISAMTKGVPSEAVLSSIPALAVMKALNPIALANVTLGQIMSGHAANEAVSASDTLGGVQADSAKVAALEASPQTAFGHLAALLGAGNTASEASEASVDAAEQGAAQMVGISKGSEDPTASLLNATTTPNTNPNAPTAKNALTSAVRSFLNNNQVNIDLGIEPGAETTQSGMMANPDPSNTGGFDFGGHPSGVNANPDPTGSTGGFDFGGSLANPDPMGNTGGFDFGGQTHGSEASQGMTDSAEGGGGGDGGTVLCTALYQNGYMTHEMYKYDSDFGDNVDETTMKGYRVWASHIAKLMEKHPLVMKIMKKPVLKWAEHISYFQSGGRIGKTSKFGYFIKEVGMPVCHLIGRFVR